MSTLNRLFDLPEQICYVQCGVCKTILLVSVPCSSMSMVVTVRCGHCTNLLSVNMLKVSFVPFQLLSSLRHEDNEQSEEGDLADGEMDDPKDCDLQCSDKEEDDDKYHLNRVINKPPEKRQRAPSAYNCFIKEEIKRLKAENPNMPHKKAFSTAAKNWAHFPPTNNKEDGDRYCQDNDDQQQKATWNVNEVEVNIQGKGFHERKAPRHSIWPATPF